MGVFAPCLCPYLDINDQPNVLKNVFLNIVKIVMSIARYNYITVSGCGQASGGVIYWPGGGEFCQNKMYIW